MFEYHAIYDKVDRDSSDFRRACLVWLGDEKSRPTYLGQVFCFFNFDFLRTSH